MDRQITLNERQIRELIEFYRAKKDEIRKGISKLSKELQEVEDLLSPLEMSLDSKEIDNEILGSSEKTVTASDTNNVQHNYNPKASKFKKGVWALKLLNKPLTISQMIETIQAQEPDLIRNSKDLRDFNTHLSGAMGVAARKKREVYREKNDDDVYVYSLLEWRT